MKRMSPAFAAAYSGARVRREPEAGGRGDVHDRSAARGRHRLERELRREHRAAEVEVERGAPLGRAGVGEVRRDVAAAARVVDEDVEAAEVAHGEGDEVGEVARGAHVGVDALGPATRVRDPGDGPARARVVDVGDRHHRALGREPLGDRPARADGAAVTIATRPSAPWRQLARGPAGMGSRPHGARAQRPIPWVRKGSSPANGASSHRPSGPARRLSSRSAGQTFETGSTTRRRSAVLPWLALGAFVLAAIAVDLLLGSSGTPSVRRALVWSVVWTVVGAGFAAVLFAFDGRTAAEEYLAGFLIEKSLSLDNLFVFAVLFTFLAVPAEDRKRVLLYGVAGAIVLRALFIVAGAAALDTFHAMTYVLGALLAVHRGEDRPPRRRAGRPGQDARDARAQAPRPGRDARPRRPSSWSPSST